MTFKSLHQHNEKVLSLQKILKNSSQKIVLKGSKPSNMLHQGVYKAKAKKIDMRLFNQVIEINEQELWVTVEPRVTLFELCQETLKKGLVPLVMPEFKSITVGGALMGAALESSSHCYGQFNDTCLSYEVLLGDGSVVTASREEHSDLFFGISGSYGTLAILTLVKIRVKRALPFVKLAYTYFEDLQDFLSYLSTPSSKDFIEGVALKENRYVAIEGEMTKEGSSRRKNYASRWFYETLLKGNFETVSLVDYLFRFDRGAFWMGRYLLSLPLFLRALFSLRVKTMSKKVQEQGLSLSWEKKVPFWARALFGWVFGSASLYRLWHKIPTEIVENLFFVHDFYIPEESLSKVVPLFIEETSLYPIWFCPIKGTEEPQFLSPHFGKKRYVNMGLYGIPRNQRETIPALSKKLEKMILAYGGRKMLYSLTYYEREEFDKAYDLTRYKSLRHKYKADSFPSLYEKVARF